MHQMNIEYWILNIEKKGFQLHDKGSYPNHTWENKNIDLHVSRKEENEETLLNG